jgi:hypothetical protein
LRPGHQLRPRLCPPHDRQLRPVARARIAHRQQRRSGAGGSSPDIVRGAYGRRKRSTEKKSPTPL